MNDKKASEKASIPLTDKSSKPIGSQGSRRAVWLIFAVFIAVVIVVFVTQKKESIKWIEDYQKGLELAKQQNRPVLLGFYKKFTRMSSDMFNNTYNNPKVKEYVEANFVPILIDVDAQPDIAKLYNINIYPTHYVKHPNNDKLFGPRVGYDPPGLFINELEKLRGKMQDSTK